MAAAYLPPPCSLRSTWGTDHMSCGGAVVPGAEVRRGESPTISLQKSSSKKFRPRLSCKKAGRWRRTGICNARFDFRGNSAEQAKEEDASTLTEMTTLVDDLFKLKDVVNESNKGVGADVRNRVDILYNRATLLKYSADNMVAGGGRVPVQLTATLKGLQREHASVENIVRLAMEAGPVIIDIENPPNKLNPIFKESEVETAKIFSSDDQNLNVVLKEKEERKESLFESLTLQSSFKVVAQSTTSGTEEYVMSAPAAEDSSPLAAFRKEIERRVMEQLSGKQRPPAGPGVTSEAQEEGFEKLDATSEHKNVLGLVQNLPLRGRLPRRREREAANDEPESADTFSMEIDGPETQPQMLQETQPHISLADPQQQPTSVVAIETNSEELEKLRGELSVLEQQLLYAKEDSVRADRVESQLQQLTEEMVATVPLDVHEQVVRLERESLVVARTKIAQVTTELKEKEAMLAAVKHDMLAEQESLLNKVKELSTELSRRITPEEVEAAVNNAVHELEMELRKALKRVEAMKLELEANEKLLKQLQTEWEVERASLRGELANVKEKMTELQQGQAGDRTKFMEAVEKVNELEDAVTRLQQSMVEAEEDKTIREKNVLAAVRSLVADMVRAKRTQVNGSTLDTRLLDATKSLNANAKSEDFEARQMNNAEDILGLIFSGEKAVALETFFVMMGVLIKQQSAKLETANHQPREVGNGAGSRVSKDNHLEQYLRSSKVDAKKMTKPTITLYYESSWEFAYLHYSADRSEWTESPGICMRNEIAVNNMPVKVIDVEGSSIEFVLTDGRGSWDCAPSGENYHIKNSGTFLLSSGFIEQKRWSVNP